MSENGETVVAEQAQQQQPEQVIEEEVFAITLYAFKGTEKGDLSFEANQLLKLTTSQGDWWTGSDGEGYFGQFPSACKEEIDKNFV